MPLIETITPAIAGPNRRVKFIAAFDIAIALITLSGPTASAISGVRAGVPSAKNVPCASPITNSIPKVIWFVATRIAVTSMITLEVPCVMRLRLRFSKRSASEPPISAKNSIGSPNDSAIAPVAPNEPVSSHARSAREICCICMPVNENSVATHSTR